MSMDYSWEILLRRDWWCHFRSVKGIPIVQERVILSRRITPMADELPMPVRDILVHQFREVVLLLNVSKWSLPNFLKIWWKYSLAINLSQTVNDCVDSYADRSRWGDWPGCVEAENLMRENAAGHRDGNMIMNYNPNSTVISWYAIALSWTGSWKWS